MGCPACSLSVPDGARFCPSCGTPLDSSVGDEERKVVTVMFADIVGFTGLSERLDPEQVKRIVDSVFAHLVADVEAHGGVVDKVLGDAIVALFGAPVAHEDDADRAVRAALAMQSTLARLGEEHPDDAIRMRIGINTGEVLVGTLAGSDYTAMGDVVNTAARLQDLAAAGSVLVGNETKRLCAEAVRFREVDSVRLRGRQDLTIAWEALGIDGRRTRRRWETDVAFVGRDVEMAMLRAVMSMAASGRSTIVALQGEPGIGKSRLVREVLEPYVDSHPDVLLIEGACAPYGETNVWWPVVGGLLERLDIDAQAPSEEIRRVISAWLGGIDDSSPGSPESERLVELVLHLLGLPSALDTLRPTAIRDTVFNGISSWVRKQAALRPVVVWVDDLQWAAPLLLDLLESVARELASFPLLVVTTYRPSDARASDWPPPSEPTLTLHHSLDPLEDGEARMLVAEAAGRDLGDDVVESISERSGGNPLFLIELARLAATTPESEVPVELPGTLRALIASRLDGLTHSERAVLDNAAIIGNAGRIEALGSFAADLGQLFDPSDLDELEDQGLLVLHRGRWRFRSDVVREVAYHTLTKQSRAQRHAGVARFLASHDPKQVEWRAHHSAVAAELRAELGPIAGVPDDITADAVDLLAESARRSFRRGAHRQGRVAVERALTFPIADADTHRELLLLLSQALVEGREMRRARSVLVDVARLADAAGDRVTRGEVFRLLGTVEQMDGDLVAARRELGRAVEEFRDLDDDQHLADALRARGFAEIFGGSLSDAEWFLGEADHHYALVADARGRAWVQQHRAWVSFLSGAHAESEQRLHEAISAFDVLGDRLGQNWSRGLLAYVFHFSRREAEALDLSAEVYEEARRWGDEWGASMMLNLQASVMLWRGDVDDAHALAERSLIGFRKLEDRFGMIQALGTLNRTSTALGRSAETDRTVEEVLALSDSFGELAYALIAAAGTAMHRGDGARAAKLAQEGIERLDTTGANVDEGRVVVAFGHLLEGDGDSALAMLLDVEVERSPFALAARATARAMTGDRAGALADADLVDTMEHVSYWDRSIAAVAGAAAADAEERHRRGAKVHHLVDAITDVVVAGYAHDVLGRLDGVLEPADRDTVGGWRTVAEQLVSGPP